MLSEHFEDSAWENGLKAAEEIIRQTLSDTGLDAEAVELRTTALMRYAPLLMVELYEEAPQVLKAFTVEHKLVPPQKMSPWGSMVNDPEFLKVHFVDDFDLHSDVAACLDADSCADYYRNKPSFLPYGGLLIRTY